MNLEQYTPENPLYLESVSQMSQHGLTPETFGDMNREGRVKIGAKPEPPAGDSPAGDPPAGDPPTPPAGDPPAGDPPTPPAGNFDSTTFLTENFGEGTTVQSILETRQQRESLEKQLADLKAKAQTSVNPFVNNDIAKLNEFIKKTGVSDYSLATTILDPEKIKGLSAEEVLVNKKRLDGINLPTEKLLEAVRQQYGKEEDEDGNVVYRQGALMEVDAEMARAALIKTGSEIEVQDVSELEKQVNQEKQEKLQGLMKTWDTDFLLMQASSQKFQVKTGDGEGEVADVEIPQDFVKGQVEALKAIVASNGLENNEESKKYLRSIVQNMYVAQNLGSIVGNIVAQERERIDAEYHGGRPPREGQRNNGNPGSKSAADKIREADESRRGR